MKENGCGCSGNTPDRKSSSCCVSAENAKNKCCGSGVAETPFKKLNIDFMYIDLDVCDRCLGTETSLDDAISEVTKILSSTGYQIEVNKTLVETEEQARELGFVSSPTIRLNGEDIQLDVKESLCESCGDICGEDVDCRVWVWQGKEYSAPPKAMIIDAILRCAYSGLRQQETLPRRKEDVPDNLKRFFAAKRKKSNG